MFAVIITEKGGSERREVFDKTEINVGRVQGNELMLAKGNVSKHHARLTFRDGRFILTDLKSTNGTYVNGRKINQATIVREGDKVYIGDFILRLEVPGGDGAPAVAAAPPPPPARPSRRESSGKADAQISHYPLEHDPDEVSWSGEDAASPAPGAPGTPGVVPAVPAPPRLPSHARDRVSSPPIMRPVGSSSHLEPVAAGPIASVAQPVVRPSGPVAAAAAVPAPPGPPQRTSSAAPDSHAPPPDRAASWTLVRRVQELLDFSQLDSGQEPEKSLADKVDRTLREQAAALLAAGQIPTQLDPESLVRMAREEILGLGPIEPLLRDPDVLEIRAHRFSWVTTARASGPRRAEAPFATEQTLRRVVRRYCARAGLPVAANVSAVEHTFPNEGTQLIAWLPPSASDGAMATWHRLSTATPSLDDFVRAGALSRAMANFVGVAVSGHLNVLVACAPGADARALVSALLSAASTGDHIVIAQDAFCSMPPRPNATAVTAPVSDQGAVTLRAVSRLAPGCLVIMRMQQQLAAETLDAISSGASGVIAVCRAPTARHALARLVPEVAALRPGLPVEAVREWMSASFDLLLEFATLRDGRTRIVRISEPAGVEGRIVAVRDVFVFATERTATGGVLDGSFVTTGVVPKAVEDLQARGIAVDPVLFRR